MKSQAVYTDAEGINNKGVIVGLFSTLFGYPEGFIDTNGVFQIVNYPTGGYGAYTALTGINDEGQVTGYCNTGEFTYQNGVFTPVSYISPPLDLLSSIFDRTVWSAGVPYENNNTGIHIAHYTDNGGYYHGLIDNNGTYSSLDYPGAAATTLIGIADNGDILGEYSYESPVPEPSAYSLVAFGAVLLCTIKRSAKLPGIRKSAADTQPLK